MCKLGLDQVPLDWSNIRIHLRKAIHDDDLLGLRRATPILLLQVYEMP